MGSRAAWALGIYALYALIAVGVRAWIQKRRTGSAGVRGIQGAPGSAEWFAGVLFALAVVLCGVAPVLAMLGMLEPIDLFSGHTAGRAGLIVAALGFASTVGAQLAMGDSWRIGVAKEEVTSLVTGGPFQWVRNPIFTSMLLFMAGGALIVGNVVAVAAWVAMFVAIEMQVRIVEETYLVKTHGEAYQAYASRVGRFVPMIGRGRIRPG